MKNQKQIDRQVQGLKNQRASIPEFSVFGTPNWRAIDEQIAIITGQKIYDEDDYDLDDEQGRHVEGEAYKADEWLTDDDYVDDLFGEEHDPDNDLKEES